MSGARRLYASATVLVASTLIGCGSGSVPATGGPPATPPAARTSASAAPSQPPAAAVATPVDVLPSPTATEPPHIVGQLSIIAGSVTIAVPGSPSLQVTGKMPIAAGSTFTVDSAGLAQLVDEQGSTVRFGPETSVTLGTAPDGSLAVGLKGSRVWATSPANSNRSINIDLDGVAIQFAAANVLAGCDGTECFVGVLDGSASVGAAPASKADLGRWQQVAVVGGQLGSIAPFAPSAITADSFASQNFVLDQQQHLRGAPSNQAYASLDGNYEVTYKTIENDRDPVTGETVTRAAHITTACVRLVCVLTLSLELKGPNGDTITLDTPLAFDGSAYRGVVTQTDPCYQRHSGETQDGAEQVYTGKVEIVVEKGSLRDGLYVADGYSSTNVDTTVVNEAGRAFGCSVNLNNDGFSATSTTTGIAVRR